MIKLINFITVFILSFVIAGRIEANNDVPAALVIIYLVTVITMLFQFKIEEVKYATRENLRK